MAGFLGPQTNKWIKQVRSRDPSWFLLAESVNDFCHELLFQVMPQKDNGQQVLSAIIFKRILSAFQAIILLGERGMHTEALIQRRGMLEALFVLAAMWHQPEIVSVYIKNDEHRRRDIYKKIKKCSKLARSNLFDWLTDNELDEQIQELEAKTKGEPYLSIEAFSQAAKLHDVYLTDYSILSEAAHHVAKDLERHLGLDENDNIQSLIWGPEDAEAFKLLFPTIDNMLMAIEAISKLFSIEIDERMNTFSAESCRLSIEHEKRKKS